MKFSLIACVFISFLLVSNKGKESHFEKSFNLVTEHLTDTCTNSGYQIYKQTAVMWEQSWSSVYNQSNNPLFVQAWFSRDSLIKLKTLDSASDGIRLYYCLIRAQDIIPSFAMVNISACGDLYQTNQESVLISQLDGRQYFVTPEQASVLTHRWQAFSRHQFGVHTPVYAYNYSWDELMELIQIVSPPENSGLWVKHGLRTLGPGDTELYTSEPNDPITGSIVYCNIVYGQEPAFDISEMFDFAKPCPTFCDFNSMLYSD